MSFYKRQKSRDLHPIARELIFQSPSHLTPSHTLTTHSLNSPPATTMSSLMRLVHLAQMLLSTYGAYHSYVAITNLQTYEATSKKLAEWSDEAARQLHRTRTTQGTAAITVSKTHHKKNTNPEPPTNSPHADPPLLRLLPKPRILRQRLPARSRLRRPAVSRHRSDARA